MEHRAASFLLGVSTRENHIPLAVSVQGERVWVSEARGGNTSHDIVSTSSNRNHVSLWT